MACYDVLKSETKESLSLFNMNNRYDLGGFVGCQGHVFVHWVYPSTYRIAKQLSTILRRLSSFLKMFLINIMKFVVFNDSQCRPELDSAHIHYLLIVLKRILLTATLTKPRNRIFKQ